MLDTVAPITSMKVNSAKRAPWITDALRQAQDALTTICRRFQRNKRQRELKAYRLARDNLRGQLQLARTNYYSSRLIGLTPCAMWRELRNMGLINSPSTPQLAVAAEDLNMAFARVSSGVALPPGDDVDALSP